MIVENAGWRQLALIRYVGKTLLLLLGWDIVISVLYVVFAQKWVGIDDLPVSMIGSALAIFISIGNNARYARWWEARQLWGGVVNGSRTFARQTRLYLGDDPAGRDLVRLQIAFAHALRLSLRRQEPCAELDGLIDAATKGRLHSAVNLPNAILSEIAARLAELHRQGKLDTIQIAASDQTQRELSNMQGGLERIKNTPMPYQYRVLPRLIIEVFCMLLPLAMVHDLGLATPLGSTALGFILLSLEQIGRDLENPFENSPNDVPLTSITRTIEINLRDGIGETDLPSPVKSVAGVLW